MYKSREMPTSFLTKTGGSEHRSSPLPCLMHTFKILSNLLFFSRNTCSACSSHSTTGRGRFQKSLNLTRLLQADRQTDSSTVKAVMVPGEPQEQSQASQGGLGTAGVSPLRALSPSAPSMEKETALSLLQRLLCYIKM